MPKAVFRPYSLATPKPRTDWKGLRLPITPTRRKTLARPAFVLGSTSGRPQARRGHQAQDRYNAACAAALAATGKGIEGTLPDDSAKARWRQQALDWLKADLTYWSKQAEAEPRDPGPHHRDSRPLET